MGSKTSRLKRITVPRKILLLLYDNRKYTDSYDVPEVVSQSGIANELNLRQNHVSRALAELISEDLIFSRSSHVKGVPRKKKVYFLNQNGLADVRGFIEEISQKRILVHTTENELREFSMEEVTKEIQKRLGFIPTYHQLLIKMSDENEIDLNNLEAVSGMQISRVKKLNIPLARDFYGRERESELILKALSESQNRFVIINSIAGQGKTALMIKTVNSITDRPVFWISLNEWSRPSNLLNDWSYFYKEHKKKNLFNYLGRASKFNIQDALTAFIKDTRGLEPVFIVDDFQKAEPDIVKMFSILKELLIQEEDILFIIASRERPTFYGRKDIHLSKMVLEIELRGLDKQSAEMILKDKNIPKTEFDSVYEVTKGHPLALELYTPTLFSDALVPNVEFDIFLGEEVIRELSAEEIEVLKLTSLFQRPVSRSAFFFKPEINQDTVDKLRKRLILRVYQDGTYDTHDLIKSYFLNRLSDFEKKKYLKIAVNYYSTRSSEKDILEYLRLLKESKDKKQFILALLENGDFLISQGYTQVGEYLLDIDEKEVKKLDRIRFIVLKSDNAYATGNLPLARSLLKKGLKNCEVMLSEKGAGIKNEEIVSQLSRIYNRSADISKLEGRLEDTILAYKQSVKLNRKYDNTAEEGKALNNLALAYRERGELDLALKQLFLAKDVFQDIADQNALALVEVNIGDIYFLKGDFNNANKYFNSVEKATLKYPQVKGLIFGKLGRTRLQMGKFKSAEDSLLTSLNAYKKSNDMYNQIKNLNDLFACSSSLKNKEKSKRYLESVSVFLSEHYKDHRSSELWTGLYNDHLKNKFGYAAIWDQKNLGVRLREYIDFHSEYPNPKLILDDMEHFSIGFHDDKNAVLAFYSDISKIFSGLSDKHPLVILNIRQAELLQNLGRTRDAKTLLEKSYPIAKKIRFKKGAAKIEEMLKN